jgi:hypothetical protein
LPCDKKQSERVSFHRGSAQACTLRAPFELVKVDLALVVYVQHFEERDGLLMIEVQAKVRQALLQLIDVDDTLHQ